MVRTGLLMLTLAANGALAQAVSPLPPEAKLEGLSRADLSARWWQWAMAAPRESNPVRDSTGRNCAVGQRGKVWFLAGGFGSSHISRECTVPSGRYLFFPVVNMVYWPAEPGNGFTCEHARQLAALNNDTAIDLFVSVDGKEVPNVRAYRARTEQCFNVFARAAGAADAFPSASDGYWLILPPLRKGTHTIKFGGRYNRESADYGSMVQDIEYRLTIQ